MQSLWGVSCTVARYFEGRRIAGGIVACRRAAFKATRRIADATARIDGSGDETAVRCRVFRPDAGIRIGAPGVPVSG